MYCPQCGAQNRDVAVHCAQCGALIKSEAPAAPPPPAQQYVPPPPPPQQFVPPQPPPQQYAPPPQVQGVNPQMVPLEVPTYMVQAVLVTLFCCLPLGIVSIFKANSVTKKLAAGDIAGALADSKSNRTLLWVGFISGLVITAIYIFSAVAKQG